MSSSRGVLPGFTLTRLEAGHRHPGHRRRRSGSGLARLFVVALLALVAAFAGGTPAIATGEPVVTSVTPSTAHQNSVVTIGGSGFTGATSVTFGGLAASFTVNSDLSITATAPGVVPATVHVVVTTPAGSSATSALDQFTYTGGPFPPSISSVAPVTGPMAGGTLVTIVGDSFTGTTAVTFGGTAATSFTVIDDAHLTATAPAHIAGAIHIIVTTFDGSSLPVPQDVFTYAGPVITSVSPFTGQTTGGLIVTINGSGFTGATSVTFGATPAASFVVSSDILITAVTPAHAVGAVDIVVTTPGGSNVNTVADDFTFVDLPVVTSLSPNAGPPGT